MLKKIVKYADYNGVEQEETLYFNLSRAELLDMEFEQAGGLANHLKTIANSGDAVAIYKTFKNLVVKSYGEKSADGKMFLKSEANTQAFTHSAAFSELLITLCSDADEAIVFVNGILPPGMAVETQERTQQQAQRAQAFNQPFVK